MLAVLTNAGVRRPGNMIRKRHLHVCMYNDDDVFPKTDTVLACLWWSSCRGQLSYTCTSNVGDVVGWIKQNVTFKFHSVMTSCSRTGSELPLTFSDEKWLKCKPFPVWYMWYWRYSCLDSTVRIVLCEADHERLSDETEGSMGFRNYSIDNHMQSARVSIGFQGDLNPTVT